MKHTLLCVFFGSLSCFAATPQQAMEDFADYPPPEAPAVDIEQPLPPSLIDLNLIDQDFILETKKIDVPGHPDAFNPSIIRWQGHLLMSFRTYNPHTRAPTPFGLVWLNDDFEPVSEPQLIVLPFANPVISTKQQDPRLISDGSRLYLVYNNQLEHVTHREMRRMFLVELSFQDGKFIPHEPECISRFEGESDIRSEKNWVPFIHDGRLLLGYSIIPHRIFQPLYGTRSCQTLHAENAPFSWDWGVPRGGTQAIRDGDHYIAFFHSWIDVRTVQSNSKKITHYVMGAYTFDAQPPFALRAVSPEPIVAKDFYQPPYYKTWKPLRCVFPAGLVIEKDVIWVSYGRQDHECWVIKLDKKKLLKSLKPVKNSV